MKVHVVMLDMVLSPDFVAVEYCGVKGPGVTSLDHLVTDLHPMVARSQAQTQQHTTHCNCLKYQSLL